MFETLRWGFFLVMAMLTSSLSHAQMIVAHRGASYDAPENTLASFRLAWEQAADAIEGDFFLTKDHQIVCIHDDKTKRTSGEEHHVEKCTLAELRQLDVGKWKGPQWAGERIPTLEEVLATVPENKKIYIEIKCGPEIVPHLPPVLQKSGLSSEQTIVISFNERVIAETRRQLPEIPCYWLAGFRHNKTTNAYEPTVDAVMDTLEKLRPHGLDVHANREVVDAAFVKRLRELRFTFHVWTVNTPEDAKYFQELGVNSLTTDRPAFLRAALSEK